MIRRAFLAVDARVLALHQAIVDASGRMPAWWSRQCILLTVVLVVLRAIARHENTAWTLASDVVVLLACAMTFLTFGTDRAATTADVGIRRACLIAMAFFGTLDLLLVLGDMTDLYSAASLVSDIGIATWTALSYFDCCRPPPPPRPRHRAVLGGA